MVLLLCIYQYAQSKLTEKNPAKHIQSSLKEHDLHSSLKANEFLTYDKCIQRMKCSVNRKEECSEECQTGNTEEEIEEHQELILNEQLSSKRNSKSNLLTNQQSLKTTTTMNNLKTEF